MYRDDRIRAAQAAKRITNEQLAELTGISARTVGLIVDGRTPNVKLGNLKKIADALNLTLPELFDPQGRVA